MKTILMVVTMLLFVSTAMAADIREENVKHFLDDWLTAQNNGSFSRYADMYSQQFIGIRRSGTRIHKLHHDAWLEDRKKMFKKKMVVTSSSTQIATHGEAATIKFEQTWESGTYKDKGQKVLDLTLEDGKLKIVREEMVTSNIINEKVNFSSVITNFQKDCKDEFSDIDDGDDMPIVCKGPKNYAVRVNFSACCEHVQVLEKTKLIVNVPPQLINTITKGTLEWRLANKQPFAIIVRKDKYSGDIALDPKKVGEVLLVLGLKSFEDLSYEIDVKKYHNPSQHARDLSDEYYLQLQNR